MNLEVLDPRELTLDEALKYGNELYFIWFDEQEMIDRPIKYKKPILAPFNTMRTVSMDNKILVRLIDDSPNEEEAKKPRKEYNRRTYKLDSFDANKLVEVESRITGDIRVNFNDKESAELYRKHIAKLFYKRTTGADYLSVSTIYKELKVVNWKEEDCDDWVYPTMDSGTLRYISDVTKTKGKNKYGFTLSAPQKRDVIGS